MGNFQLRQTARSVMFITLFLLGCCCVFSGRMALAQVDQGAITGVVKDIAGAVIPNAVVTLTNTDTNFVLQSTSDGRGQYDFSPIKIGNYTVSATAPGFETTTQENVRVNIQDRLGIDIALKPGGVKETVMVTAAPPMLQGENASVGQVMDTDTINETALNGRNWVYIAQLTAGVDPAINGLGRGAGTGDFAANGQRTTQNNFILDGVDNNVDADDLMNGASYNVRPPPDALAEFKIDTSNYSAEFGHSAGAVLSASIKSGTNQVHGDMWEYVRNTRFDGQDWDSPNVVPAYHENQFGATLGLPIWRNKIFYFGDAEANRITFAQPDPGLTVPTPLERVGNFTELFNSNLNSSGKSIAVFSPTTAGYLPLTGGGTSSCNTATLKGYSAGFSSTVAATPPSGTGVAGNGQTTTNILCSGQPYTAPGVQGPGQMDPIVSTILSLYPMPNTNGWTPSAVTAGVGGATYANYNVNLPLGNYTWQWDQRLDWNISAKDQTYARYSYTHQQAVNTPALGPVLDGGAYNGEFEGAFDFNLGQSLMLSETHLFTPKLINEFRFGYNWGNFQFLQSNSTVPASTLIPGMNGVPFGSGQTTEPNGGLPFFTVTPGITNFGAREDLPSIEHQNVYQILDNLTKIWRSHSLKFGGQLESIRASISQPYCPRGRDHFATSYTKQPTEFGYNPNKYQTGWTVADLFTDNMANTAISPDWDTSYYRWYGALYAQDDWKVNQKLTLNLGVRYDNVEPISNNAGDVANLVITSAGIGSGAASFVESTKVQGNLTPTFVSLLAGSNVTPSYTNNLSLVSSQKKNFAPRVGFAYQLDPNTVVRSGFGLFYGGIEVPGASELTDNYPFGEYYGIVYNASPCQPPVAAAGWSGNPITTGTCPSDSTVNTTFPPYLPYPATLETGMSAYITGPGGAASLLPVGLSFNMSDTFVKTPYTMSYNLTTEHAWSSNMVASLGYVGNVARHLYNGVNTNGQLALTNPNANGALAEAFPNLGIFTDSQYNGESMYNALQAKLEKRLGGGLSYLATYTWSHAGDDSTNPGIGVGPPTRSPLIIPLKDDFTNSSYDTRQRFTFNGFYALPFGRGKKYANNGGVVDYLVGGWQSSLTWQAQSGTPITVYAQTSWDIGDAASGGNVFAYKIRNAFIGGGTPDPTQAAAGLTSCPATVKNKTNWYNPCAFANPLVGTNIPMPSNAAGQPNTADGSAVVGASNAIAYLGGKSNQIPGPGYERINMSVFKSFKTWREQSLQFRADAFNLFNHPSWGNPSDDLSNDAGGGDILGPQSFQLFTPDSRFFQLSAKYVF
jgi:hypothetical protein